MRNRAYRAMVHIQDVSCPETRRGGQHLSRGALERPVGDSWNPEGALLRLARLGDIDPPNVRRAISLAVDGLEHRLYPALEPLLRRLHRLTIHPGGGSLRNL